MRFLIIGCGYVGSALARRLVDGGHAVRGVTLSPGSAAALKRDGIAVEVVDCATAEGARAACRDRVDGVVFSLSSRGGDYQRTYVDAMGHVLAALKSCPPASFIYTGSTSVYAQTDGEWIDEKAETAPSGEKGRLLLRTEQLLKEAAGPILESACVLRLAAIYGPGRHVLLNRLRRGIETWPGDGCHWMNQIHRDDIVSAIELLLLQPTVPGVRILNGADDSPVLQRDYVEWCCAKCGCPVPKFQPRNVPIRSSSGADAPSNRRIRNLALRDLGWTPKFPDFREGLAPLLDERES
jgi:nucleoside-diphosphate-sugar epimerase